MSAFSPFREDLEQLGPFETLAPDSASETWEAEPESEDSAWESEVGGASRLSGPAIGPMHGQPLTRELRRGVAADAKLSPLAITLRGLRRAPYLQRATIAAIVVHNTSRGPANRSKKGGYRHPAVHYALNYYIDGDGGFPHYVIDFNGTIYATCDERRIAHHAGWVHPGGAKFFKLRWTAPRWWSRVWSPQGAVTPLNLLPKGARSPNHRTIGVELLILPDLSYTPEQYRALARLVVDIQRRNADVHIPSAPSRGLLGHEDFAPVTGKGGRADPKGGWDPGAHREKPYFDWQRVWVEIQAVAPGFGATGARELELELGPFEAHVPDSDEAWEADPEWEFAEQDPEAVDETRDEDTQTFDPEAVDESWEVEDEAPLVRTTPYPASALRWPGATDAQRAFMRAVYELMVKRAQAPRKTRSRDWIPGRSFIGDLPKKALDQIERGHWARKDAAAKARELLAAARADLAADGLADRVKIGILSAYRSAAQQWYIWQGLNPDGSRKPGKGFPHYYAQTAAQRRRLGDEHGPRAVELQARYMGKYIAAPGFSDHNNGIAIDFGTGAVGKRGLGKIADSRIHKNAWFHDWLLKNAARFDFIPLPSEPWHWEYQPSTARSRELEEQGWAFETEPLSEAPWSESDPELEDEIDFESEREDEDELAFEDELEDGGELEFEQAVGGVRPGLLDVDRVALLARHRGSGPALRLRWNAMPSAVQEIDVIVHLHGYGGRKMTVAGFERSSGLDLGPVDGVAWAGRSRPTLTVLPRGHMTGRRARRARPGKPPPDFFAYTFPGLLHRAGLPKLVAFALERFAAQTGASAPPRIGRLILTAHSGGGAALLRNLEHHADKVDEVHAFDALYQDAGALARWAKSRMKRDRSQGATPGGAMRVFYGRSTRRHSEVLLEAIRRDIGSDPGLRARYRVEASTLGHWQIPRQYGWRVLADAGADVPSIQTTRARSSRELEDWIAESEALEDPTYGEDFQESWHEDEHVHDDEALGDAAMLEEWVAEVEDASHAFAEAPDAEIE